MSATLILLHQNLLNPSGWNLHLPISKKSMVWSREGEKTYIVIWVQLDFISRGTFELRTSDDWIITIIIISDYNLLTALKKFLVLLT